MDRASHRSRLRRLIRYSFIVGVSVTLISTRLFGAAPENDLSTIFQQVLGENLSPGLVAPLNDYVRNFGPESFSLEGSDASENLAANTPDFPAYNGIDLVSWIETPFQEGQNPGQPSDGIGTAFQEPVIIDLVGWIESWFQDAENAGNVPEDNQPGLQEAQVFDMLGWIAYGLQRSSSSRVAPGGLQGPEVFDIVGWIEAWLTGGQGPESPGQQGPQILDVVGWIEFWFMGPDSGNRSVDAGPGWQGSEIFDVIGLFASWFGPGPAPTQPATIDFQSAVQTQVAILEQQGYPGEPPEPPAPPPPTEPTAEVPDIQTLPTEVPPTEVPPTEPPVVEIPPSAGTVWVPPKDPPESRNLPPTCSAFSYSDSQTSSELTINISSQCSDPEGSTWQLTGVTQGNNGSTRFDNSNIYYTPNAGFAGADTITFTIVDSNGSPYTQSFNINIANLPPVANTDTVYPPINISNYVIDVLANDTDSGNDPLYIVGASWEASNGFVEITPDPTVGTHITYTPDPDYIGPGTISYTLQDSHGAITTGTVNVDVGVPPWCGVATGHPSASGCLVSNVMLNGVPQTDLTVNPDDTTFTLQFDYHIWSHPGTSWIMQIMPGIENTFSGVCAYDAVPGVYPGYSGTSPVITMPVPAMSGSYRIFIPRDLHFSCGQATYYVHDWIETVAMIIVP
jgi:hypothetical protein